MTVRTNYFNYRLFNVYFILEHNSLKFYLPWWSGSTIYIILIKRFGSFIGDKTLLCTTFDKVKNSEFLI